MATLFDPSRLSVQPPDERTDADAPNGVAPAQGHSPLAARGDVVLESEADTTLGRQLLAAIAQAKAELAALENPVAVAPAPPPREVLRAAPVDVQVARGDGTQESEPATKPVGSVWLTAIAQAKAELTALEKPVAVAPAPPPREVPRAAPFDMQAALAAVEHATSEEEAMAALMTFVDGAAPVVQAASDPFAALASIFGAEVVSTVTAVCAEAVVDLEAESAATGGPITDRAATRIARSMVDRMTRRAGR